MLQLLQSVKNGELSLRDVPSPAVLPGTALVRTGASLISAGTEKMILEMGRKSLLGKAKARPELVRQVLTKAKNQGVISTVQAVLAKLDKPTSLGYSAAGIVEAVGSEVSDLKVGDRVAVAGAGYANHAEINCIPRNLIALIPEGVTFEEAAYTTVASIAMQGVRLGRPELGELVVVSGLGLIGLIVVQLLKANGCKVLGIDFSRSKIEQGLRLGMDEGVVLPDEDPHQAVDRFTKGRGADLTMIAAATTSNDPIELAGQITRRKGNVIVIGAVGLNVPREIYYRKEIGIQISMSYGPGRYDSSYEEDGLDYPYDYVRWTEQRNMEAVLDLMARKRLDVHSLTTHRFPFAKALSAYEIISKGTEPFVGLVLEYDIAKEQPAKIEIRPQAQAPGRAREKLGIGFIGAGNYASALLLPQLKKEPQTELVGLVTATGLSAKQKAEQFGFAYCGTDVKAVLDDAAIDVVFITTRHSTHADFAIQALAAGKQVFVEKPMVVSEEQLETLCEAYQKANAVRPTGFMLGLNRRFAPMVTSLKQAFKGAGAQQMIYRVNSGHIPVSSWTHKADEGGGMLIGEMCHFIDLMQFICEERPVSVFATSMAVGHQTVADRDNVVIVISFDKGSVGTLCYNTVGNKAAPKERLEVYGGGVTAFLDDFRSLEIVRGQKPTRTTASQDKGQAREVAESVAAFRTGTAPIPFDELVIGMRAVFAARESLVSGEPVKVSAHETARELIKV